MSTLAGLSAVADACDGAFLDGGDNFGCLGGPAVTDFETTLQDTEPEESVTGDYLLRKPKGTGHGTIVLQESAVTYAFLEGALAKLEQDGFDPWVYYVSSAELFDLLPREQQHQIFPEQRGQEAMGVTGFTMATLYRWIQSDFGRSRSLHPFRNGHFLGSGQGAMVLAEAGLDGEGQYRTVKSYLQSLPN